MSVEKKLIEMFTLQNKLNNMTNGENWINGYTKNGKKINWNRCIYMEAAELIDSFSWKHWKDIDAPSDIDNAKIELVDIWYFIMSKTIENKINRFSLQEIAENSAKIYNIAMDNKGYEKDTVAAAENIIRNAVNDIDATRSFFCAIYTIDGFTIQDVYKLYIGKNCLNQFRQDNGYKEGTYKKIWNDKEDNVYMQEFLNNNPDATYNDLYQYLNTYYNYAVGDTVENMKKEIIEFANKNPFFVREAIEDVYEGSEDLSEYSTVEVIQDLLTDDTTKNLTIHFRRHYCQRAS